MKSGSIEIVGLLDGDFKWENLGDPIPIIWQIFQYYLSSESKDAWIPLANDLFSILDTRSGSENLFESQYYLLDEVKLFAIRHKDNPQVAEGMNLLLSLIGGYEKYLLAVSKKRDLCLKIGKGNQVVRVDKDQRVVLNILAMYANVKLPITLFVRILYPEDSFGLSTLLLVLQNTLDEQLGDGAITIEVDDDQYLVLKTSSDVKSIGLIKQQRAKE